MRKQTIPQRVSLGVKMLDAHFGNKSWQKKIKVKMLDMTLWDSCILGQLFREYSFGVRALFQPSMDAETFGTPASQQVTEKSTGAGFNMYDFFDEKEISSLTAEWKRRIRLRKSAAGKAKA